MINSVYRTQNSVPTKPTPLHRVLGTVSVLHTKASRELGNIGLDTALKKEQEYSNQRYLMIQT